MQVPSGVIYDQSDIDLLEAMARHKSVEYRDKPFRLKSGIDSHVYVFCRNDLTENPHLEWMVGHKIAGIVFNHHDGSQRKPILVGIPTAGNALAQAGAMASLQLVRVSPIQTALGRQPIGHRIMREKLKEHGANNTWVDGQVDLEKHWYWMVDNVVTDGKSKLEAAEKLTADGYPAKLMPCLIWVDRQQGAVSKLQAAGFKDIVVGFNLLDITYAFGEMKLWPKTAVRAVEEEIHQHQFL